MAVAVVARVETVEVEEVTGTEHKAAFWVKAKRVAATVAKVAK